MNQLPRIYLQKNEERKVSSGFPWIYSNQIQMTAETKAISPGACVMFCTHNEAPVAIGYFNRQQLIAGRVLSLNTADHINVPFFANLIKNALTLREAFFDTPHYRLIHAESDFLPGFIVDRFGDVVVVQANTYGAEVLLETVVSALQQVLAPKSIVISRHQRSRQLEGLPIQEPEIIGEPVSNIQVLENNVRFDISLQGSQKTGWFYDHRDNRKYMAALAKGKHVIDYFCYAGGFAVQCAVAGAASVTGVDQSETAIVAAQQAAELNQVSQNSRFVCANVFEDIEQRIRQNERFDVVLLDPPAFVKSKKELNAGLKGYQKLIARALHLVATNGLLMIASCSYHVSEADLQIVLQKALAHAKRPARIVKRLSPSPCHPKHPALQEAEYLKGLLVHVS